MSRIDKINQRMKEEIGAIVLQELKDPRLAFVTITQAVVSRDLQHAKVYYSVLGTEDQIKKVKDGLSSARGFVRKLIGQRVRMRYTPEIEFILDPSLEYSARIEETLKEIHREWDKDS